METERIRRVMRIWSAGCSSVEEPYTLAMVIDILLGENKSNWDTKILATDVSEFVLKKAKVGIYSTQSIKDLPDVWKKKYFAVTNEANIKRSNKIQNEVIFRRFNLIEQFSFKKKFHLIMCRNVMIYFDDDTKIKLINKFYNYLEPGGYLFIEYSRR